jgi:hypothetical protein
MSGYFRALEKQHKKEQKNGTEEWLPGRYRPWRSATEQ